MNKFYWIKLRTDFFSQETIDFLLSQHNGCQYVVLYQMLCLNTANNAGRLESSIGEMIIPYSVEKIARDTKYFSEDTVRVALELYKKLGLVYEEDNGILAISQHSSMVGSESASHDAIKKRRQREAKKLENATGDNSGDKKGDIKGDKLSLEIRDKRLENRDIEYRDKNIDRDIYIDSNNISSNFELIEPEIVDDVEFQFNQFYKEYPNHVGKKEAYKAFIKAVNGYSEKGITYHPTSFNEILEGCLAYKKQCYFKKTEKQYIKHPSTWLNQRCWEDDYDTGGSGSFMDYV